MRVKIGNIWHSAAPGQPIAIELTGEDKANIAAMLPHCTRCAWISDEDARQTPPDVLKAWLDD